MRKSQKPAAQGNVVRAAIYRTKAERYATPELEGRAKSAIQMDIYRLVRRLHVALRLEDRHTVPLQEALLALVNETPRGIWTAEAKFLYDLQRVCVDHERETYTVDLAEWALTLGRRPIKRALPNQRDVLMLKHLAIAAKRLTAVRVSDQQRGHLALLIEEAEHRIEHQLREKLRPQITNALDKIGFVPRNMPERVARKKLIEELIDHVEEHGFLAMGDLRDAISRNKLKLPDVADWRDFFLGDQLLRADRKLATALDGIYRRGEFYLRWMQRISSLAFGTSLGRFFTLFGAVPFGGAYIVLAGLHHLWELIARVPSHASETVASETIATEAVSHVSASEGFQLVSTPTVLALALFLMCLVNSPKFRQAVAQFFKTSFRICHAVIVEPISWVIHSPLLQAILHSRLFSITFRFVVKPLLWTAFAWVFFPRETWQASAGTAAAIFLAFNLLLNSRIGRNIEEVIIDALVQGWHRFGLRFITGLFWWTVEIFKGFLDAVEQFLYTVDEWLRFKSGESNVTLATKAVLGLAWFFIAYVLRFCVNVLIEPQINPIKHFPVVTVSHKLLLGLYKPFADLLEVSLGIDAFAAWAIATGTIWGIPGVFGFLVWELTSNWRLYAANRRPNLFPMRIGSHGETMSRLLKQGFHSGTLPKRYAKLRHAEHRARSRGNWHPVRKQLHTLRHIETSVRRYVEREFLELFVESRTWQIPSLTLDRIRLGTNCVRLAIGCRGITEDPLVIAFEVESGWLAAGIASTGWTDRLPAPQRQVLITALLGLYKSAGVELVRQQIEDLLVKPSGWYDITATDLILWPERDQEDVEVVYNLHEGPWIAPQSVRGLPRHALPTIERQRLLFQETPLAWNLWVGAWLEDAEGHGHPRQPLIPVCVLAN
jgi:hypothetical protein